MEAEIRKYLLQKSVRSRLGLGEGAVSITLLGKGKFHKNYRVTSTSADLVFRIGTYKPHKLNKKSVYEYSLLQKIAHKNISPKPVFQEKNYFKFSVSVIRYVPGIDLSAVRLTPRILQRIGQKYANVHSIKFKFFGAYPPRKKLFSLKCELLEYYKKYDLTHLRKKYTEITAFEKQLLNVMNVLDEYDAQYRKIKSFSLLKGDNKLSNIVMDNDQITFIDWEFAKVGFRLSDIASFLLFAKLNKSQEKLFVAAYARAAKMKITQHDLDLFILREFCLKSIWTLNKVSEGRMQNRLKSLKLLKRKTAMLSKHLNMITVQ